VKVFRGRRRVACPERRLAKGPQQALLRIIQQMKQKIRTQRGSRGCSSAAGLDDVAYRTICDVPDGQLADLFKECIARRQAPEQWMLTLLVALPKAGKDARQAANHRLIGLESCMLKTLIRLIDGRLSAWAEANGRIPDTQNGFLKGRRTCTNPVILRMAVEKAAAKRQPLYVVFLDLTNAFNHSTISQPRLFLKLHELGARGPIVDWLRWAYDRMHYKMSRNQGSAPADGGENEQDAPFGSNRGILAGDSASYMADMTIPANGADVRLDGRSVCHLEHADDLAIFSTSIEALQAKVDAVSRWCEKNSMLPNPAKFQLLGFNVPRNPTR
jgi:hypothetical protein